VAPPARAGIISRSVGLGFSGPFRTLCSSAGPVHNSRYEFGSGGLPSPTRATERPVLPPASPLGRVFSSSFKSPHRSTDRLWYPPLDPVRFQHPADRGRGNPQLLSDLCHGQTFRVEAGQLVPVYDQPRPAADAPLLACLRPIACFANLGSVDRTIRSGELLIKTRVRLLESDALQSKLIKSFRHRGLKRMYEGDSKKIDAGLRERVEEILTILDGAKSIKELGAPAYRLHPLKGPLKGYWSMTVSANWRIIFRFDEDGPADVDLVDYH